MTALRALVEPRISPGAGEGGTDSDIMQVMMVEIARGLAPEQSSMAPFSDEEIVVWSLLKREMQEIAVRGQIVDIPADFPDVRDYEPGKARRLDGRGSS